MSYGRDRRDFSDNFRETPETSGILPGPQILGNVPERSEGGVEVFRIPEYAGEGYSCINPQRVVFTYSVHGIRVTVNCDLNSDFYVTREWKHKDWQKALDKARRKVASYGASVGLDELIADGWTVS